MHVTIEREQETKELSFAGTVNELLTSLAINPRTVLVIKNDELVTEDVPLTNDDRVEILSVVSGG